MNLPKNEIHVWHAVSDHAGGERLAEFESVLSEAELSRAGRYATRELYRRAVWSRGILRQLLGLYVGEDPKKILLVVNEFGKPHLRAAAVRFNVSHSRDRLIYAFALSREVGVDVELLDRRIDPLEIAQSFFSQAEAGRLRGLPEEERRLAFFECWTRKEAFLKALGQGLSIPLDSFEVSFGAGKPAAFVRGGDGWFLRALRPSPDSVAAVAGEGAPCGIRQFAWHAPMEP